MYESPIACPRFLEFGYCSEHDCELDACTLIHGSKRVFYKTKMCSRLNRAHDFNACAFSHSFVECNLSRYLLSTYLDALREVNRNAQLHAHACPHKRATLMSAVRSTFVDVAQRVESVRQQQLANPMPPPPPPPTNFVARKKKPVVPLARPQIPPVDSLTVPRHLYESPPPLNRPTSLWGDRFFTLSQ